MPTGVVKPKTTTIYAIESSQFCVLTKTEKILKVNKNIYLAYPMSFLKLNLRTCINMCFGAAVEHSALQGSTYHAISKCFFFF